MPMYEQPITRSFLALLFVAGLILGGLISSYITVQQIHEFESEIEKIKSQISQAWGSQQTIYQNVTVYQSGVVLSEIYEKVKDSVVLVSVSRKDGTTAKGSGFIYNFSNRIVVITNYHVIHNAASVSITFSNGEAHGAKVLGKDPYADLAVLSFVNEVPREKLKPLAVVNSSTLKVGDPVIAIGNPYGLVGSMTTGLVSGLGRTITEEYTGGFAIANIIQTSAPINPGNSGGPLLNIEGNVVGITTAIISDSQGLGFAIPSNTLLREIYSLVTTGEYHGHSYLGIKGSDLSYEVAQNMKLPVTYGWLIQEIVKNGPSDGKLRLKDVIVALNGTKIRNGDDLASYLEEKTLPGNTLRITVYRKTGNTWNKDDVFVILGERPPPPV